MSNSKIIPAIYNPLLLNVETLRQIFEESKRRAHVASVEYAQKYFEGRDGGPRGVVWVNIYGIKGNTKLGRALKKAGIERDSYRSIAIWNPSGLSVQSTDIKGAGAEVAAEYLRAFGFDAYVGSRTFK